MLFRPPYPLIALPNVTSQHYDVGGDRWWCPLAKFEVQVAQDQYPH
jgi:hypothetical protein